MKNILRSKTRSSIITERNGYLDFDYDDFFFDKKKLQQMLKKYNSVSCYLVFSKKK